MDGAERSRNGNMEGKGILRVHKRANLMRFVEVEEGWFVSTQSLGSRREETLTETVEKSLYDKIRSTW